MFGFLTPIVFSELYVKFITNLGQYINYNKNYKESNLRHVKLAKKRMLKFIGLALLGISIGGYLGFVFSDYTGLNLIKILGPIIGAKTTEKMINYYLLKDVSQKNSIKLI